MNPSRIDKPQTSTLALEDITMPSLGADMTEGMLTEWLIKEGDQVTNGDIIAVLETQKGAIDMEVYSNGTIEEILISPGTEVQVGTVLARLALAQPLEKNASSISVMSTAKAPVWSEVETPIKASPIVRRLAKEQQLNLTGIKGSGPQDAILLNDITALLKLEQKRDTKSEKYHAADNTEQNMRNAIARAMAKSKQNIPHFYLNLEVELGNAQHWLQQKNKNTSPEKHLLLLSLLLKALANALVRYPQLNGFYQVTTLEENGFFEQASAIHIGNVISLRQGGLVVPAIHDVDQLSVFEVMQGLRDITERSRSGHLRSSELMDATITVTNMGERGADSVFGIIYPPQVAIVGFGKVRKTPKIFQGNVVEAPVLTVSLSADHRVIDGMLAAKFMNYLAKQLQKPERL